MKLDDNHSTECARYRQALLSIKEMAAHLASDGVLRSEIFKAVDKALKPERNADEQQDSVTDYRLTDEKLWADP